MNKRQAEMLQRKLAEGSPMFQGEFEQNGFVCEKHPITGEVRQLRPANVLKFGTEFGFAPIPVDVRRSVGKIMRRGGYKLTLQGYARSLEARDQMVSQVADGKHMVISVPVMNGFALFVAAV